MYKPYKTPVTMALPDVKVAEPRISSFVVSVLSLLSRPYLCTFFGMAKVVLRGDALLFDAFKRALAGESRCIVAFRHANGADPQLLAWFFLFKLRALAARKGVRFARKPHAVFVYGYEVARWGGWTARTIMPNIGALPVHHSKIDTKGMDRILKAISEGPYPLALAPEGQVSYFTNTVPRLEAGAVGIGFQAAAQLEKNKINCPVEILPVSIHLRYGPRGEAAMARLLRKIEKACGFSRVSAANLTFAERLRQCREHILAVNESRYKIKGDESLPFEERLGRVINAALETAERMLGISGAGEYFSRLYKVRQICWDRIYVPGIDSLDRMPYVKRNAMDLGAGEAWYIARHQELADFCWYFRRPLPARDAALHDRIEYVQNLWDFANRSMGGAFSGRINIFPRQVSIQTAAAINLSGRLSSYKENRKAALAASVVDLEKVYLDCIDEVNEGDGN
jgi:1-acyl-sn-glycerol-3-phosphate acyltransferase